MTTTKLPTLRRARASALAKLRSTRGQFGLTLELSILDVLAFVEIADAAVALDSTIAKQEFDGRPCVKPNRQDDQDRAIRRIRELIKGVA